jgi:hypothetical protein
MNLAVLLMIGALAVPVAAQSPTSTSGVVVSSTTESLVVRMDDGTERKFNVTSTTGLPSARLAEGNRVTVQYRPLDGGLFEAARIELAAAVNRDRTSPTPEVDHSMTSDTTEAQREAELNRNRPLVNPTPDRSMMSEPAAIQGGVTPTERETAAARDADATERNANEDNETLPSTASPRPLLALSGIAALISGLLLKARRTA